MTWSRGGSSALKQYFISKSAKRQRQTTKKRNAKRRWLYRLSFLLSFSGASSSACSLLLSAFAVASAKTCLQKIKSLLALESAKRQLFKSLRQWLRGQIQQCLHKLHHLSERWQFRARVLHLQANQWWQPQHHPWCRHQVSLWWCSRVSLWWCSQASPWCNHPRASPWCNHTLVNLCSLLLDSHTTSNEIRKNTIFLDNYNWLKL